MRFRLAVTRLEDRDVPSFFAHNDFSPALVDTGFAEPNLVMSDRGVIDNRLVTRMYFRANKPDGLQIVESFGYVHRDSPQYHVRGRGLLPSVRADGTPSPINVVRDFPAGNDFYFAPSLPHTDPPAGATSARVPTSTPAKPVSVVGNTEGYWTQKLMHLANAGPNLFYFLDGHGTNSIKGDPNGVVQLRDEWVRNAFRGIYRDPSARPTTSYTTAQYYYANADDLNQTGMRIRSSYTDFDEVAGFATAVTAEYGEMTRIGSFLLAKEFRVVGYEAVSATTVNVVIEEYAIKEGLTLDSLLATRNPFEPAPPAAELVNRDVELQGVRGSFPFGRFEGKIFTHRRLVDVSALIDLPLPVPKPIPDTRVVPLAPNSVRFAVAGGREVRTYLNGTLSDPYLIIAGAKEVRTATADFDRDGYLDTASVSGPGNAPALRVARGGPAGGLLFELAPFEAAFTGGAFVAAGDLDGDGVPEVVVTPDRGGGPRVRVFSGRDGTPVADFFGIDDPAFRGGARAAVGDLDAHGAGDLVVSAGFQGGPRVAGYSGRTLAAERRRLFADFFVFEETLRNGAFVAAGDVDGDGKADLVAGGGPSGGPRVFVLGGAGLLAGRRDVLADFFAGDPNSRGGVRVAVKDVDGDARLDLLAADGDGGAGKVRAYYGKAVAAGGPPPEAFTLDGFPSAGGGV